MFSLFFLLIGCAPDCEKTCKKILECEEVDTPMLSLQECTSSCAAQEEVYNGWDDEIKREAFDDLKSCIVDSECADVAEGVCYDDDLYIW